MYVHACTDKPVPPSLFPSRTHTHTHTLTLTPLTDSLVVDLCH
jgi:hypothetical protein